MPASVWRAELSFDGFAYTSIANPFPSRFMWQIGLEAICLPLLDPLPQFNPANDFGNFYLSVGVGPVPHGWTSAPLPTDTAWQTVQFRIGDPDNDPPLWTTYFGVPTITGAPATLAGGGTLTIIKDYDNDLMTFIGPLGTQTIALSTFSTFFAPPPDSYQNTVPMRPRGYAEEWLIPDATFMYPAVDLDNTVSYYNLVGKENGTPYFSVALSAGDPGTWWPAQYNLFDPVSGNQIFQTGGTVTGWTYSQLSARQKVETIALAASYPDHTLQLSFRRLMTPMPVTGLDVAVMDEHAILFRGWPLPPGDTDLQVSRSHDFGHSWTDYTAVADGHLKGSVSVAVFAGQVYCVYYDTTAAAVKQVSSLDLGNVWSSPMPVSITGTNPRLVIAADGPFFYFYMSGGNLVLQRSFDLGSTLFDGTPIIVAASVPAQDFAAVMATDRSLNVAYSNGGVWFTRRSLDYGNTWFDA